MAQTTNTNTNTNTVTYGNGNIDCPTTHYNYNTNNNTTVYNSDKDEEIMRWLSPLEPNTRHQGLRNDRFDGVGDWLLETREFRGWRGSEDGADKAILFCSGNPGVGKTYLR